MGLVKNIVRSRPVQEALGFLVAGYLGLVRRTNRFVIEPADAYDRIGPQMPVIAAMWHGQHFMIHYAKRPQDRAASLVSRSGDGEFNAVALRHLGVRAIRGSGARGRDIRKKGGARALRGLLRALTDGEMVVMTADIPKISRICGTGIVTLAQLSGRPIVPVAVVTSRRIDFKSWDSASIGLPFGRGAMVLGDPISVPREADAEHLETMRQQVERALDTVHERAYALIGSRDPGANTVRSNVANGTGNRATAGGATR
ncbi:lysophospholipid acyltransferase family protein [Microvirga sp. 2MCAF38]|uniref:lysophospholipid acyltransferase family protein n=1 Tax=Microvirga sp. 2MCAF38 TaxID=3232989 RepID=UPI003F9CE7F8